MKIRVPVAIGLLLALLGAAAPAAAASAGHPGYEGNADFVQHLGRPIPSRLSFRDERGHAVRLGDYLGSAPIGLIFAYYRCANLCPMQIRNLAERIALASGGAADAQIVVVSIDPEDTPEFAVGAKHKALDGVLSPARAERWHFLSGAKAEIVPLAQAVGFSYGYDEATHQFAHPAGFALINADGKIARYFFGLDYTAADLSQAFDAAAARRIASPIARLLLVCFHYDITTGRYTGRIIEALRLASMLMLLGALAFGWHLLRRTRRQRHSEA
jgi:protein SCO1/2